jgi:integrase
MIGKKMKVRIPYVNEYRDRTGKVRRYLRRRGQPRIPLPGLPGSPEFWAAYNNAMASSLAPKPKHGDGTIGSLVLAFYQSAAFQRLAESSKKRYRLILDKFAARDGHRLVRDMPHRVAVKIIEEIGVKHPAMANLTSKVLRQLFIYAIKKGYRSDNPFAHIEQYKVGFHRAWTEAEIYKFEERWPIGSHERLAFDLLLYTSQRCGDVAKMRRDDYRDGAIHVSQQKTGAQLVIPVHPMLKASIAACPCDGEYLISSHLGRPYRWDGLSKMMSRAIESAGLGRDVVPHGLRKSSMNRLAHSGASAKELSAISGHRTLKEVERYTPQADQAKLARAAMAKLTNVSQFGHVMPGSLAKTPYKSNIFVKEQETQC